MGEENGGDRENAQISVGIAARGIVLFCGAEIKYGETRLWNSAREIENQNSVDFYGSPATLLLEFEFLRIPCLFTNRAARYLGLFLTNFKTRFRLISRRYFVFSA